MDYKKLLIVAVLLCFLVSTAGAAQTEKEVGNNKDSAKLEHQAKILELKEQKEIKHSELKSFGEKAKFKNEIKDVKDFNDKAEVYSDEDVSDLEVWKGNKNELKFKDHGNHKVINLKIRYSDLEDVPGFYSGNVRITHYNDAGIPDVSWVQYVPNDGGYGYIDCVPFSEVVIGGYVGKYIKTGKMVYQDSNIFGLGATFEPGSMNYISATVEPEIIESGPYDIPIDGLMAEYRFDTPGSIIDYSGNENNLSITSPVGWTDAKYNQGVVMYNSSIFGGDIDIPDNSSLSVFFVMRANCIDKYQEIFSIKNSYQYFPRIESNNKIMVQLISSSNSSLLTDELEAGSIQLGQYTSFGISYSRQENSIFIYQDGELIQKFLDLPILDMSTKTASFGGLAPSSFNGTIDQFLLYDRALSASEFKQLHYDTLSDLSIQSNSVPSDPTTGGTVSVPFSDIGADISTLTTSVPTNTTIDNVTVRYYNETVTPFNITAEVGYFENTTITSEELTDEYYRVYITHIPGNDYESGFVNYASDANDILDSPFVTTSFSSNNENATHTLSTYDWSVSTGPINAGQTYNYVLTAYLEGTEIDDIDRDGIGYTGLGAYEAEGNETVIIGSRFTAYSSKESEWGGNGSDIYIPVAAIIGCVVVIIAMGFAINGLREFRRDE